MNNKKIMIPLIGIILGALSGYFYWQFKGCESGTCMITSKPLNSTLYGALLGYLLVSSINDFFNNK